MDLNVNNVGTDIARITNPTTVPSQWKIEYLKLTVGPGAPTPDPISFGSEALTSFSMPTDSPLYNLGPFQGNYVLVYGYYVNANSVGQAIAIMIPNAALANTPNGGYLFNSPYPLWRLSTDGNGNPAWKQGLIGFNGDYYDINQGQLVNGALASFAGYSVRYNANVQKWQLVSVAGNGGISRNPKNNALPSIWLGTSAIGPFSQSAPVAYAFPQTPQNSYWNQQIPAKFGPYAYQNTQCYAIREWQLNPNQEDDSSLFFTYTAGSTDNNILEQNLALYQDYTGGAPNPFFNRPAGAISGASSNSGASANAIMPGMETLVPRHNVSGN